MRTRDDRDVSTDVATLRPIDRDEMVGLAATEYERLLALLRDLRPEEWELSTVCDAWDVRAMVAHLLGAAEGNASIRENVRQLARGRRRVRGTDRPLVDGINDVQVEERHHLTPAQLLDRLAEVAPKAIRGRHRTPKPVRRLSVPDPTGPLTIGHLVDIIYTRDEWLHRVDISAATGRPLQLTADHDGRIVADVVREWAATHGEPVVLELTGPAGGRYHQHDPAAPVVRLDAVIFCETLSGRRPGEGLLAVPVLF
jgi:uncharacterized protein (TIGR03083 family)